MEDELLSIRAFAKEINKSHTWVADKCKDGFITLQNKKIPRNKALEEIREHGLLENKGKSGRKKGNFPPIVQSKERYEFYRANKMEIDLSILEGKTIDRKKALNMIEEIYGTLLRGIGESAIQAMNLIYGDDERENFTSKYLEQLEVSELIGEARKKIEEIRNGKN